MDAVPGAAAAPASKKVRGATKGAPPRQADDRKHEAGDHGKAGANGKPDKSDKDDKRSRAGRKPHVASALGLGWRMEQLYRVVVKQPPREFPPPERLGGLGDLSRWQRFALRLDQVEFLLADVCDDITFPASIPVPSTDAIRDALTNLAAGRTLETRTAAAESVRAAVNDLHEDLVVKLNGADSPLGTAYGLGRSLADTCRPNQTKDDLNDSFRPYRLSQLYQYLSDLASLLPEHAAKAVRQSLTWWRDAAYRDGHVTNPDGTTLLASVNSTSPGLMARRRLKARLNLRTRGEVAVSDPTALSPPTYDLSRFVSALERQGEMWRNVLTGDKDPLDLLDTADYVVAARSGLTQAWRLLRTRTILVPLALILAGLGGLIYVIVSLDASGGSKIGGALGAAVTFVVAVGRTVGVRAKSVGEKLEGPIWSAELDLAIAEAVTLPPAGTADPGGWATFATRAPKPAAPPE